MPVSSQTPWVEYAGNGTTTTGYTITFTYQDESDIDVYVDSVATTAYSISGGKVYTNTAIESSSTVRIELAVPLTQDLNLVENGDFSSTLAERAWDRAVYMIQQLDAAIKRCLRVKRGNTPAEMSNSTNHYVYIDSDGDLVVRTSAQMAADVNAELNLSGSTSAKPTTTWADDAARAALAPDFTGQVGVQLDTDAIYVATGLSAGNWELYGSGSTTFADSTARDAAVPEYYAQLGLQTDTQEFFIAVGLAAGAWKKLVAGPPQKIVSDSSGRTAEAPDFVGQILYQQDTQAWYVANGTTAGDWAAATAWATSQNYTIGDLVTSNNLLWECRATHTGSVSTEQPGSGTGWEEYWKPWLVQGYHWDYKKDPNGNDWNEHIVLGLGELLPDWGYAFEELVFQKLPLNGGGSGSAAWIDGTPLATPTAWATATGYSAGDFVENDGNWFKCHTGHTSNDGGTGGSDDGAGDNEPGIGTDWRTDGWIQYPHDTRVDGAVEFTGGIYYTSRTLKVPPSVTLYAEPERYQRNVQVVALAGYTDTYLYEGVPRSGTNGNSNFFTSCTGITWNPNLLCKAVRWFASHGSRFFGEIKNHGRYTPFTLGSRCDDCEIEVLITDTATPLTRAPYGIYSEGGAGAGPLNILFKNCVIGQCNVGFSFGDVEGCTILNSEMESVTLPLEVRVKDEDAAFQSTWATTTVYAGGERVLHNGTRYRCYNSTPSDWATATAYVVGDLVLENNGGTDNWYTCAVAHTSGTFATDLGAGKWTLVRAQSTVEPGVGAAWTDYFEEIADTGVQGRCGGLNVIGGRWLRHYSDTTFDEVAVIRIDQDDWFGFTMQNVHLDLGPSATALWNYITVQDIDFSSTHDYPYQQNLESTKTTAVVNFDARKSIEWSLGTSRAHNEFGTGSDRAKTVDTRWVVNDNPANFTTNRNEDVTVYAGWYDIEVVWTTRTTGTITIDDENGVPLPGFNAITANTERRVWIPCKIGSTTTINVEMASGTTEDADVYVKPVIQP